MILKRTALLIVLAGALTATSLFPVAGPYGAVLGGGWIVSLLTAVAVVPALAKRAWAKGVSDPSDPARVAFAGAVEQDVLPKVEEIIQRKMGDLDAQRQRVEGELASLRLSLKPLEPLAGLARRVKVKSADADGKEIEIEDLALTLTLGSIVNVVNDLADWMNAEDGLKTVITNAYIEAAGKDALSEMGKKGNAALQAKAEAMGAEAAQRLVWLQEHPEQAEAMAGFKEEEEALDEVLGMMGIKGGGAIAALAKKRAKRDLAQRAMGGAGGGAPSVGFRPM